MAEVDVEITGDVLLTVREAARHFRVSTATIRKAYWAGHLRTQRVGRHIRIPKQALIEWRKAGCPTTAPDLSKAA